MACVHFHRVACGIFLLCVFSTVSVADPLVEVNQGRVTSPVGASFFDLVTNPLSGSPTAPSIMQKEYELSRIPGAVDLIPAERYKNGYAQSLKDIASATPGVFVENRYGEEARLSIRGSGLGRGFHLRGITLLQDGVPINLSDDGGDFQELDPLTSRFVEIYKGANGWGYGASSLGGAINVVTPTGHTAEQRNLFRLEAGSFGTVKTHLSAARVIGDTDFYIASTALHSDGYRDQSRQDKARLNGNVGFRLSDTVETRFYAGYNNLQQEVPGTLTLRQALDSPQMAPAINKTNDYARDIKSVRLANKTTMQFGDKTVEVGAYTAFKDLFHPIVVVVDQESRDYGSFVRLKGHYDVGGYRNDYQIGLHGKIGKINAKNFSNSFGSRGAKTGDSDQRAAQIALNAENQFYATSQFAVVTGAQFVHAKRDFKNNLNAAANDDASFNAINPKLGMIYDFNPSAQFFANVARSSEAPTFSELVQTPIVGFVPLEMQTAWTAEFGTRGNHAQFAWDVTAYHARLENELLNFVVTPNTPASVFNAGHTIHQGIEAGFDWDLGRGFLPRDKVMLRQVYTVNDFRFNDDAQYASNRIAGVPLQQYRAELRYKHGTEWSVTPNIEITPDGGFIDHANTVRAPGYAVLGIGATYNIGNGVELFADARNVLDKRYVSNYSAITNAGIANTAVFYPGEGRSIFAGIKVSF